MNKVIKKNKGILIFVAMIILFSFIATRRVEKLEQNNYSNNRNVVYNK